jgi:hypothetical protein
MSAATGWRDYARQVEIWQRVSPASPGVHRGNAEWAKVDTRVPLRLGRPLPLIPFIFCGPRHSMPEGDKLPLAEVIAVNLDHYRLHADYRHGMHFTVLPTAWVAGFEKGAVLDIGSSTAWVSDQAGGGQDARPWSLAKVRPFC